MFGRQLYALGVLDVEVIDSDSSIAFQLMEMYEAMGHTLALQVGVCGGGGGGGGGQGVGMGEGGGEECQPGVALEAWHTLALQSGGEARRPQGKQVRRGGGG